MIVVGKAQLEACRGYPEQFRGWGAEDEAMAIILDTLVGPHVRLPHDLIHFWHPAGPRGRHPDYSQNRLLFYGYSSVAGDPEAMWELINDFSLAHVRARRVRMVALVDLRRDGQVIKAGHAFLASVEEAHRENQRSVPLAVPAAEQPRADLDVIQRQIRRQAVRQVVKQQQTSFQDRRLELAGQRTRRQA